MSLAIKKHEDFEVNKQERLKVIRQERISVPEKYFFLEIDNLTFPILNYTPFGIAIKILKDNNKFKNSSSPLRASFLINNIVAAEVEVQFVRENQLENYNEVAFELVNSVLDKDHIHAIYVASDLIENHQQYISDLNEIPSKLKSQVYEVKDWMEDLEEKITQIEESNQIHNKSREDNYDEAFIQVMSKYVSKTFLPILKEFKKCLDEANENERIKGIQFFRNKLKNIAYRSPFAKRVYEKPLGYAGDFESMNLIYNNDILGKKLFEKIIHHSYLQESSPSAVRNRSIYLTQEIESCLKRKSKNDEVHILSIASGPSKEWQNIIENGQFNDFENIHVYLLDQDPEALQFSQEKIKSITISKKSKIKFHYVNKAIKNLIEETDITNLKYDLIYSAGLFDYLSGPVAKITAKKLYSQLNHNSELIIGNFNTGNPDLAGMQLIFDWNLIYRSHKDLEILFSNISDIFEIKGEELNINLFCHLKRE